MAGPTESSGGLGGFMSPAESTSMPGMIFSSSLVLRNESRHASRTARSGLPGFYAAI